VGGNVQLLAEILDLFRTQRGQLQGELRDALERRDAGRLTRAAHTLKGTLGSLGATTAYGAARRLEALARAGDLAAAADAHAALAAELDRLETALATTGAALPSGGPGPARESGDDGPPTQGAP
jgi:protein-histidine pros-kinase